MPEHARSLEVTAVKVTRGTVAEQKTESVAASTSSFRLGEKGESWRNSLFSRLRNSAHCIIFGSLVTVRHGNGPNVCSLVDALVIDAVDQSWGMSDSIMRLLSDFQ